MILRAIPCLLFFVFLVGGVTGRSQERERTAPPADTKAGPEPEKVPGSEVSVKKVGETLYRIGAIEFDAKTRVIRFPATVNMNEGGPLEYVLVHEKGKVHESIFTTTISPLSLQVALKLLRYEAGQGDVFNHFLTPEALEKEGGTEAERGNPLSFTFEAERSEKAVPIYEFVIDGESGEAMTPGPWIYTGSVVDGGTFMAEAEGSIIAIYLDHLALFNMTRDGAEIDERWGARHSAIPEIGTKGIITIEAFVEKQVTKEE